MPTFIETQFPIARLSAESYKERKANTGQTLARWRGDKRFSVSELGVLASRAEKTEWNELDGAWEAAREEVKRLRIASKTVAKGDRDAKERARTAIKVAQADRCGEALEAFIGELQVRCFSRFTNAERMTRCDRPENVDGPTAEAWSVFALHRRLL